ncbi:MAG: DUF3310 domain-containing protein [Oscillospiraceae bacterium]
MKSVIYEPKGGGEYNCEICGYSTPLEADIVLHVGTHFSDEVIRPQHYTSGGVECIDAIRAALSTEEFRGYCKGNVIKYTWRENLKGGDTDLKKAEQYLKFIRGEK